MTLLAITGQTWFITGLGFGIVLVLLFVFVYVMKLLGWIMQPRKAKTEQPQPAQVQEPAQTDDATKAAIAYSLHLYYNSLHDPIETHLTIKHHATAWHIISSGK
jgi:Na+-transporting methylmalonyl-CoA/oxaloacetate decarboxylase gamma subunit